MSEARRLWLPHGTEVVTRRRALALFGATGVALVAAACSGGSDDAAKSNSSGSTRAGNTGSGNEATSTSGTTSGSTSVDCVLTPEMTEGPFYLDDQLIRRDITEGTPGIPLRLELTVADAATCATVPGLLVEIWHADALGTYSGFGSGGSNTTFLRGGQRANADGVAVFQTIYPGWYRGRAVHIHLKVHDGNTQHTTQLFFDQELTDELFTQSPYQGHSGGTTNAQDSIYRGNGSSTTLRMTPSGDGYTGALTLGIRR